jgi:hypothetical protein
MKTWVKRILPAIFFLMGPVLVHGAAPAPTPLKAKQIPGMKLLIKTLRALPIYPKEKAELLAAVLPTEKRPYYRVSRDFISPGQRQELVERYSKLLNTPESKVVLFAVTNSALRRTALFPEFYDLKSETAQAALLFHESLWNTGIRDYRLVIRAEEALQTYLEHPKDPEAYFGFYFRLARIFYYANGSPQDLPPTTYQTQLSLSHVLILAALAFDRGHAPAAALPLRELLGDEVVTSWLRDPLFNLTEGRSSLWFYYNGGCCDGETPEAQRPMLFKALKLYFNESQADLDLPHAPESWDPRDLAKNEPPIESFSLKTTPLSVNDRGLSFQILSGSKPAGRLVLEIPQEGAHCVETYPHWNRPVCFPMITDFVP